jgi:hypothetical protein
METPAVPIICLVRCWRFNWSEGHLRRVLKLLLNLAVLPWSRHFSQKFIGEVLAFCRVFRALGPIIFKDEKYRKFRGFSLAFFRFYAIVVYEK